MESQSKLSNLSADELKRNRTKCEEQLKNLLKVFPHLAGPDTRSLAAQYVGGDEWEALANLQSRIRDIKLELLRRGELPICAEDLLQAATAKGNDLEPAAERNDASLVSNKEAPEPAVQSTLTADGPKGFDGLGQKQTDLSPYFDSARLTDRQRECASMKWEYGLRDAEIARRLGLHHSTIQEALRAVTTRLQRDEGFKRAVKKRASRRNSHDESN